MLIDPEFNRYSDQAPSLLRRNVDTFLEQNALDRAELERASLRPFKGHFDAFYVSTVARGLAGSKSDVDLILVSYDASLDDAMLSNMLFHGGRRVGVKVIKHTELNQALLTLREISGRIALRSFVDVVEERKRVQVDWQDLERLINGISFNSGAQYLTYLPDLCRVTAVAMLQEFYRQVGFVRLATSSHDFPAAAAYAYVAVISAMDAVMATCGRVQSNSKWTLERWHHFVPSVHTPRVLGAIARITRAREALQPFIEASGAALLAPLMELQDYISAEFVPTSQTGVVKLCLSDGTHRTPFLPGADSVGSSRMMAIVDSAVLDAIETPASLDATVADGEIARHALQLLQVNILSCKLVEAAA